MFGLFKKKTKDDPAGGARLLCAAYDAASVRPGPTMISRSDAEGLTTVLMAVGRGSLSAAGEADLRAMGLTRDAAWAEAERSTRALLGTFVAEPLDGAEPATLALVSTTSYARHAALLFWGERPDWSGRLGAMVLLPADRFSIVASRVDSAEDAENAVGVLMAVHESEAAESGDDPGPPTLYWRDAVGFEPVVVGDGEFRAGPRLRAALRRDE